MLQWLGSQVCHIIQSRMLGNLYPLYMYMTLYMYIVYVQYMYIYSTCICKYLSSRISDKLLPFAWQWGSSTGPILSCRLRSVWKGRFPSKYTINISSGLPSKYKMVTCRREPCTWSLTPLLLPRSLKQLFRCLQYKEFSKKEWETNSSKWTFQTHVGQLLLGEVCKKEKALLVGF